MSNLAKPTMVDRISDLPDEILCHILSFLPTKDAFATSVLSERWISLYQSLDIIHFDDKDVIDYGDFLHFCHSVDAVTCSPHVKHIKKFHLKFSRFGDWYHEDFNVHEWIEAAKGCGVEDIFLSLNFIFGSMRNELITLTNVLFNFPNLVVLKLNLLNVPAQIVSFNLPSLKTLHLIYVYFGNSMDLKRCLSGCPILEELLIIPLKKVMAEGFETSLSNLVRATIRPFDIPFKAIYNVEFLRIIKMDDMDNKNINAYYKEFPVFCNLIHLEILFLDYDHSWSNVAEVLQHSPKLQILLIRKNSSNYYTYRKDWKNPNLVPECVSSHLKTCTILDYEGWKGDIQFARYILKNARFLRVMRVRVSRIASYRKSQILEELSSYPRISEGCKFLLG